MNSQRRLTLKVDRLRVCLWVIFLGVFRPEMLPDSIQIGFRVSCLLAGLVVLVISMNVKQLFNASLIYIIPVVLSCLINYFHGRLSYANLINGIQHALCVYELYSIMKLFVAKGKKDILISNLCGLSGLYCVASVITIIVLGKSRIYFIGSKYMTGYIMMFYLGIKYYHNEGRIRNDVIARIKYITILIVFEVVIWYINCMTCFVAVFIMTLIAFVPDRIKKILSNPWVVVGITFGSLGFIFLISSLVELKVIQDTIQNSLHKSLTLTGRVRYYERALDVFRKGDFWFGYGYASDAMRRTIALGTNIQNGLLQEILNYGVLGGVAIVALAFLFSTYAHKEYIHNWPLFVLIIGFLVSSLVEVSMNKIFFMSLFAMRWLSKQPDAVGTHLKLIA